MADDYITRAEFEEAIAALRCYGDQQTLDVTHTPGGQILRSNHVLTEEGASDTSYVSVSYDSGTEKFTVTVTNLPVISTESDSTEGATSTWAIENEYLTTGQSGFLVNATLIFDKPASTKNLYIRVARCFNSSIADRGDVIVVWGGNATTSDSDTQDRYSTNNINPVAYIRLMSDGTHSVQVAPNQNDTIFAGSTSSYPIAYVSPSTRQIKIEGIVDAISRSARSTINISYSEPVSDNLVMGFNYGDSQCTYGLAGGVSLDVETTIGTVVIDSNNRPTTCRLYNAMGRFMSLPPGATGTATSANTLTITNGIITEIA